MNIVERESFEARLRTHLTAPESISSDVGWYSVRNMVYAFGARVLAYNDSEPNSWSQAQDRGWAYFQNAFSVHSDLVFCWSSVTAIQALFIMVGDHTFEI